MSSQPPRFVPTLTEVVQPVAPSLNAPESLNQPSVDHADFENHLVQRVLQRVDLILERRLREAIGQVIAEHTGQLTAELRMEIEAVVRRSVSQAFSQELESDTEPAGIQTDRLYE